MSPVAHVIGTADVTLPTPAAMSPNAPDPLVVVLFTKHEAAKRPAAPALESEMSADPTWLRTMYTELLIATGKSRIGVVKLDVDPKVNENRAWMSLPDWR